MPRLHISSPVSYWEHSYQCLYMYIYIIYIPSFLVSVLQTAPAKQIKIRLIPKCFPIKIYVHAYIYTYMISISLPYSLQHSNLGTQTSVVPMSPSTQSFIQGICGPTPIPPPIAHINMPNNLKQHEKRSQESSKDMKYECSYLYHPHTCSLIGNEICCEKEGRSHKA
jgi:hypothetical protein